MNALDYFLKANLYGLLFASCYWLFLRRHTFFTLNRAYLLTSTILSLVLPLASLPTQAIETLQAVPVGVIALPIAVASVETGQSIPGLDWKTIGLLAYGLIALILLLRVAFRAGRLLRLIRRSPRQARANYVLVQPSNPNIPTFSFFGYMILNPADVHNDLIINHELVHIRQHHSADVIGISLVRAVFWVCPSLWLIDQMLRQVHEFLADNRTNHPTEYARFLVEYTFGVRPDTLTNGFFNPSLLKQRIMMLHQRATNRWALGKYILVLPLAFGMLAMTTAREKIAAIVNQATDETITVSGRVTTELDGGALPGANLVVANTGKGTHTDAQGNYKLQHVPKKAQLSISFVGFTTKVISVHSRTTIDAALAHTGPNELPTMGATSVYKSIKPNPSMSVRTPPSSETINGKVYTTIEEPAVFPTGVPGLMQYVARELRYPAKAKAAKREGVVLVQFIVMPNGFVGTATIKRGFDSECNVEAVRVVKKMPPWLPGKQNGKAVATEYVIPIQFALEKKEDRRTGKIDPETFYPTGSPIGEFPTVRETNYPNLPRLTMVKVKVPASALKADTVPLPGLMQKPQTDVTIHSQGPLGQLGPEPLYIIDGVEIPRDTPPPLKGFNQNDIHSINILKGASATAAYGNEGKYGVIEITTKKK